MKGETMIKKASIPLLGLLSGLALMAQATKSQVPDCCSQYNNCVMNGGLNGPDCSLPLQECVANTGLKPADLPLACAIQVVSYASNLNLGDAVINLTNTGAQRDFDPTGNICANVYTFSPDEQMV